MEGGAGLDTYQFDSRFGIDNVLLDSAAGSTDLISFGPTLPSTAAQLFQDGNALLVVFDYGASGYDMAVLEDFFIQGTSHIVRFGDGVEFTAFGGGGAGMMRSDGGSEQAWIPQDEQPASFAQFAAFVGSDTGAGDRWRALRASALGDSRNALQASGGVNAPVEHRPGSLAAGSLDLGSTPLANPRDLLTRLPGLGGTAQSDSGDPALRRRERRGAPQVDVPEPWRPRRSTVGANASPMTRRLLADQPSQQIELNGLYSPGKQEVDALIASMATYGAEADGTTTFVIREAVMHHAMVMAVSQ